MRGQIFISYRRATDAWAVDKLRQELVGAFGAKNVFLDRDAINAGEEWAQRIEQEIKRAAAVVVVFSQDWYGETDTVAEAPPAAAPGGSVQPAGTVRQRRIDNPRDPLRLEVEWALKSGRPVFPIVVDGSPEPRKDDLPREVQGICDLHFLRMDVSANFEAEVDRLIGGIRRQTAGRDWLWRLGGQSLWLGLLALSIVVAWHALGVQESFRNAFARGAMALRERVVDTPPNVAIVEMNEREYRELFGGRNPLDAELVEVLLRRLLQAGQRCDSALPVVLNLDIAPVTPDNAQGDQARMTRALLELAACRPVVMACPAAVRRGSPAWYEMRWMNELQAQARANPRIRFAFGTGMADPEGLRRAAGRSEIGVVAADLAAGRAPFTGHAAPACVCPGTPQLAARCAEVPLETAWDERGFAVPLPGSSDPRRGQRLDDSAALGLGQVVAAVAGPGALPAARGAAAAAVDGDNMFTLNEALLHAEALMRFDAVVIGSNRAQSRHAVPGRPRRAFEGVSTTVVQAHLLNGALNHEPVRGRSGMLLVGLLAGWAVAAVMLLAGLELERNDQRYSHRGGAYLLFVLGLLGVPLLALLAGAQWPDSIWWLALVALVGLLAAGRAVMSCFEIVLSRGMAWRWPHELNREYLYGNAKASTALRLLTFLLEAMVIVACWSVVLWRQAQGG